jgi:hypothetical protein
MAAPGMIAMAVGDPRGSATGDVVEPQADFGQKNTFFSKLYFHIRLRQGNCLLVRPVSSSEEK